MPRYRCTARHPIDLGTGAFGAPGEVVDIDHSDTVAEHLEAGRLVEVKVSKPRTRKTEEES